VSMCALWVIANSLNLKTSLLTISETTDHD
jgi:hypothetical protein